MEWGGDESTSVIGGAHAVEDASKIKKDFCLDVVAGILDLVKLNAVQLTCCLDFLSASVRLPSTTVHRALVHSHLIDAKL